MAYKKIILAVDCENEQEQQMVQVIAKELSEALHLKAKELIDFYPILHKHKALLYTAITTISREGKKGLLKLVPLLIKQL